MTWTGDDLEARKQLLKMAIAEKEFREREIGDARFEPVSFFLGSVAGAVVGAFGWAWLTHVG